MMIATDSQSITDGWELTASAPGACAGPLPPAGGPWLPAVVPGTVAGALRTAGADQPWRGADLDELDWWFRTSLDAPLGAPGERLVLHFDGLATVAEVYLSGERVLESESMFTAHAVEIAPEPGARCELVICVRALGPRLQTRRRPRARWRTALVSEGNLRFYRTMLMGRAPGFAPGPPVVGPYRPVRLERRVGVGLTGCRLRASLRDGAGRVTVSAALNTGGERVRRVVLELSGPGGGTEAELCRFDDAAAAVIGELIVDSPELWWPHTHGRPALYDAALRIDSAGGRTQRVPVGRVGFRDLTCSPDLEADGPGLTINGVDVFARGAVWTPVDLLAPTASRETLRERLERLTAAGLNMVRVPGTAAYEADTFHDLCDELGILVWQDFMFANLDYPESDASFMAQVTGEVRQVLERLGGRPSLAVLCGGSEVAQQVAMLGLDPALAEGPLYGELLPRLVAEAEVQAPYVPSAPWGGELPFRTDRGVANYYGVGAYLRPLEDARRAEVRFAAECLAFANVPDEEAMAPVLPVGSSAWKTGVPRDTGAGWDFDDVRDHYLERVFGIDPVQLRSVDMERYLELSRAISGEVMAETFGEWRRASSPCEGALVLWLADLAPGAGWGLLDHRGVPKVAYHHLRRALAPVAVWTTDEGLGGVDVHVANDHSEPLAARLRVTVYRDGELRTDEAVTDVALPAHGQLRRNVEAMLGRFVDASWAYRFGPPAHDVIVASLERANDAGIELLSQSFRFPAGRPLSRLTAEELGLRGTVDQGPEGDRVLRVTSRRLAYGVRPSVSGHITDDDAFSVEPGHERILRLTPVSSGGDGSSALAALNLRGRLRLEASLPPHTGAVTGARPDTSR
jgi:beta-mannosidase